MPHLKYVVYVCMYVCVCVCVNLLLYLCGCTWVPSRRGCSSSTHHVTSAAFFGTGAPQPTSPSTVVQPAGSLAIALYLSERWFVSCSSLSPSHVLQGRIDIVAPLHLLVATLGEEAFPGADSEQYVRCLLQILDLHRSSEDMSCVAAGVLQRMFLAGQFLAAPPLHPQSSLPFFCFSL